MDGILRQITTVLRGVWQKRWYGLITAWVIAVVGLFSLARVPDQYEASARVYVDTSTILKPLMTGLAVQPDLSEQISLLGRTLISRPNLEKLVSAPDIGFQIQSPEDKQRLVDRLMRELRISLGGQQNLYDITYRDTDPARARRLVEGLVGLFMEMRVGDDRRDTEQARKFIDEQIEQYETRLTEAENKLRDFKLRNMGYVGEGTQNYFGRMAALQDELGRLRIELRAAEQARDSLRRELSGEGAQSSTEVLSAAAALAVNEINARIEVQRKQLDELLRRYTDQHPDVLAARRLITQLEQQRENELAVRTRAGTARERVSTNNPVYQQIKIQQADAESKVAALQARISENQQRLDQLRGSAGRVPQVEAELAQLNRDYDVVRRNYEALVTRRESANLSSEVDKSSRLAEFRVVDPPRSTPHSVFPNRPLTIILILLGSLGVGGALSFGLSQLFPTFHSLRELRELTGRPVLGAVSLVLDAPAKVRQRMRDTAFLTSLGVLVFTHLAWMVWAAARA